MADGDSHDFFDCRAAADLLSHDVRRVARSLGIDSRLLRRILMVDGALARALISGTARLVPSSPEGVRAVRLVRLNRALGDAFGSVEAVIAFLRRQDPVDGTTPLQLLEEPQGIERVFARIDHTAADEWRPRGYVVQAGSLASPL